MKVIAKLFSLFGYVKQEPDQAQVTLFKKHIGDSCDKCHGTFNNGLWWAFTKHIMDDHGVDPEVARDLMTELTRQYKDLKITKNVA